MRITTSQAQALAAFVSRVRDDWDHPGIVAAIQKAAPLGSPAAIGAALCRLAENRELRTPAMLADPGTHWSGTTVAKVAPPVMCPEHPAEKASACKECIAAAVPADQCAAWRRPTPTRRPTVVRREPQTDRERADALRALIDQETEA